MKPILEKSTSFLIGGMISMVLGLILGLINSNLAVLNFLSGLFLGLSIPLNIVGLYKAGWNISKTS